MVFWAYIAYVAPACLEILEQVKNLRLIYFLVDLVDNWSIKV